jgi:hypothetical protein
MSSFFIFLADLEDYGPKSLNSRADDFVHPARFLTIVQENPG